MIKLIQCVRRRADMPVNEFRGRFAAYRDAVCALAGAGGALKVVINTRLEVSQNDMLAANRGTMDGFDGVVEISWKSGSDIEAFAARPGIRELIARLRREQAEFMDLESSSFFLASEEVAFEGDRALRAVPRSAAAGGKG